MGKNYNRREILGKGALGFLALSGIRCKGDSSDEIELEVFEPQASFLSNTGFVNYINFSGTGYIVELTARYNGGDTEHYSIEGTGEGNRLMTGKMPLVISKEITGRENTLEFEVIDHNGKSSPTKMNTFFVPNKQDALAQIKGILLEEGGFDVQDSDVPINVKGYGEIIAPIWIRRLDGGKSVMDYVGIEDDLKESVRKRDALHDAGYDDLFIMRAPTLELSELTGDFIRNGYRTIRTID